MNQTANVSHDTLWIARAMIARRIGDLRVFIEKYRDEFPEYYDLNVSLLREYIAAHNEIARALGTDEIQNETEE